MKEVKIYTQGEFFVYKPTYTSFLLKLNVGDRFLILLPVIAITVLLFCKTVINCFFYCYINVWLRLALTLRPNIQNVSIQISVWPLTFDTAPQFL